MFRYFFVVLVALISIQFSCGANIMMAVAERKLDPRFDVFETLMEMESPIGNVIIYRPNLEEMVKTSKLAKSIFLEAFATTYTEYYEKSDSNESIEKWLRLKEGLTLEQWLNNTFDGEYQEYLEGKKRFIFISDKDQNLLGWLSHTPVSEKGEVYLSQCSLEAKSRNQKVTTTVFTEALKGDTFHRMFPEVKEVKLIARKINTIARRLYNKAGFTEDETIDPSIYGESYDERYVGYRMTIKK